MHIARQALIEEYFIVCHSDFPESWHSGKQNETTFIEALSPRQALEKIWASKNYGAFKHLSYYMEVHANANDYHRNKEPLAQRSKAGDLKFLYR